MDRLWETIEAYLAEEQVELDDLELSGRTLRVVIDSEDGVDLDHITDVSRGVSRILDETDGFIDGKYNLEVTSPGLERKLRRPRHFQKSLGRQLVAKTRAGDTLRGELTNADAKSFTVEVGGKSTSIAYDEVAGARTVLEFTPPPKPGKK